MPRISLLVDARGLRQSGIGRYLRAVLAGLIEDERFESILLAGRMEEMSDFAAAGQGGRVRLIAFEHGFYSPAAQADWWRLRVAGRLEADLAFFPHYDVPLLPGRQPRVVTVHDLNHFRLPELYSGWKRLLAGRVLDGAVGGAQRVIVPSESTRRDLLARRPSVAARVEVIPQGVEGDLRALPRAATVSGRRIEELTPYLLCVGNRKRSKNLVAAVEALARLRREGRDLTLVLVGQAFGESDEVSGRAERLGVRESVVEFGSVADAELRGLYAGAECLLFPSLYEGFGLPPLEAMAHRTPVVASSRGSTPEVVGDAGLIVEPDGEAMADGVRRILDQPSTRRALVRRGERRAAELSWDRTAAATADLLVETVLARRMERGAISGVEARGGFEARGGRRAG